MSINYSLRFLGHSASRGPVLTGSGVMVWKFIRRFWDGGGASAMTLKPGEFSDAAQADDFFGDASFAALPPGERKKRSHERDQERQSKHRDEEKQSRDRRGDADLKLHLHLMEQAHRQAIKQLSDDIDDAIAATRLGLKLAGEEEDAAREAMEAIQQNSIVLGDGRRVYFAKSGKLYGEDLHEIIGRAVDEARRLRDTGAKRAQFEDYQASALRYQSANVNTQDLAERLVRLDDLKERSASGKLSPSELEDARKELDDIVAGLPPGAREDYDRLRQARRDSALVHHYDPAPNFNSGPNLNAQFLAATRPAIDPAPAAPQDPAPDISRVTYKSTPDY
jgi:hypothetical protein